MRGLRVFYATLASVEARRVGKQSITLFCTKQTMQNRDVRRVGITNDLDRLTRCCGWERWKMHWGHEGGVWYFQHHSALGLQRKSCCAD